MFYASKNYYYLKKKAIGFLDSLTLHSIVNEQPHYKKVGLFCLKLEFVNPKKN